MKFNKPAIGYIFIIAILIVSSIFSLNLFFAERTSSDKFNIADFPLKVDSWMGKDIPITEKEYQILETRNLIVREYQSPKDLRLWLFIIYSETNRSVFHPPEVCLLGSGIKMIDKKIERIEFEGKSFSANKLYVEKNGIKEIMLYSYKAGNLYTDNYYLQQAYFAFKQIFSKRVPGATIRVSMPIGSDEDKTLEELKSFLVKAIKIVDK